MHAVSQQLLNPDGPSSGLISPSNISDRRVGDVTIVDLNGPLTRAFAVQAFHDRVRELLQEGATKLAVNLEDVRDLDSSGVGGLAAAYKELEQTGGQIKLFAASGRVRHTLHRLRFDTIFEILEDEKAALQAFDCPMPEPRSLSGG